MILAVLTFAFVFFIVLGSTTLGFSYLKSQQKKQIRSMLRNAEATIVEQRNPQLLRAPKAQDHLAKFLRRFEIMERLDLLLQQAGKNRAPTNFLITSGILGAAGFLVGLNLHFVEYPLLSAALLGSLGGALPTMLVLRKRAKAFSEFERQFPEALDFLSRSMRAGHGFTVAMEMLAADSPDPLGAAFRRVSNDLQLGSSLETALTGLMRLVPLIDVRFFVSSVLVQQETGGNLGEILTKLAHVIRERFRVKGQVKAVSAHGRITGLILLLMPIAVSICMFIIKPGYVTILFTDETGRSLVYGAIAGQIVGYFVIRKIVDIKV